MKITFLVENTGCCGGNRTILTIAEGLYNLNHDVKIICNKYIKFLNVSFPILEIPNIKEKMKNISTDEVVIATFWTTAYTLLRIPNKYKFYLCQHYETIFDKKAKETYSFPFNLIVTSTWLHNKIKKEHKRSSVIINPGVNRKIFYPSNKKKKYIISFSSPFKWKGFEEITVPVFKILKEYNFELHTFGPLRFKDEKSFNYFNISDKELASLYSSGFVYLCSSIVESPGLPVIESMSCGTPVISTALGTDDYIKNNFNSFLVKREPNTIVKKILEVFDNTDLYNFVRKNGIETSKKYTWEKTINSFNKYLLSVIKNV